MQEVYDEMPDSVRDLILIQGDNSKQEMLAQHKRKIDELIATYIQGWDLDRLAAVDRNILRIAIFEILWAAEIPDAVAIDEALVLAKDLSTEESAGYIHGVLAKITSIKSDLSL
jgi:N utilization substance protein B